MKFLMIHNIGLFQLNYNISQYFSRYFYSSWQNIFEEMQSITKPIPNQNTIIEGLERLFFLNLIKPNQPIVDNIVSQIQYSDVKDFPSFKKFYKTFQGEILIAYPEKQNLMHSYIESFIVRLGYGKLTGLIYLLYLFSHGIIKFRDPIHPIQLNNILSEIKPYLVENNLIELNFDKYLEHHDAFIDYYNYELRKGPFYSAKVKNGFEPLLRTVLKKMPYELILQKYPYIFSNLDIWGSGNWDILVDFANRIKLNLTQIFNKELNILMGQVDEELTQTDHNVINLLTQFGGINNFMWFEKVQFPLRNKSEFSNILINENSKLHPQFWMQSSIDDLELEKIQVDLTLPCLLVLAINRNVSISDSFYRGLGLRMISFRENPQIIDLAQILEPKTIIPKNRNFNFLRPWEFIQQILSGKAKSNTMEIFKSYYSESRELLANLISIIQQTKNRVFLANIITQYPIEWMDVVENEYYNTLNIIRQEKTSETTKKLGILKFLMKKLDLI